MTEHKLKNYDYEFYFLAILLLLGIFFYLLIKLPIPTESSVEVSTTKEANSIIVKEEIYLQQENATDSKSTVSQPDGYIIDGIDFSKYNANEEGLKDLFARFNYETIQVLATTNYNGAVAILSDGNLYTMKQEMGSYLYYLVFPKNPKEVVTSSDAIILSHLIPYGKYGDYDIYSFSLSDVTGENIEVPIDVTYLDGSKENITLYITKMY